MSLERTLTRIEGIEEKAIETSTSAEPQRAKPAEQNNSLGDYAMISSMALLTYVAIEVLTKRHKGKTYRSYISFF
jgi:hypothetical protein